MNDLKSRRGASQHGVGRCAIVCVCMAFFIWAPCFLKSIPDVQPKWNKTELALLLAAARGFYDGKDDSPLPATLTQKLVSARAQFTLYLFDDPKNPPVQSSTLPVGQDPKNTLKNVAMDLKRNEVMARRVGGSGLLNQIIKIKNRKTSTFNGKRLFVVLSTDPIIQSLDPEQLVLSPVYNPHKNTLLAKSKKSVAITPVDVVLRQATRQKILGVIRFSLGLAKSNRQKVTLGLYEASVFGEGTIYGTINQEIPRSWMQGLPPLGFIE